MVGRTFLYHKTEEPRIFVGDDVANAIESGEWFDSPDKVSSGVSKKTPGDSDASGVEVLSKTKISRLTMDERTEYASNLYGIDVSEMSRGEQIDAIVEMMDDSEGPDKESTD